MQKGKGNKSLEQFYDKVYVKGDKRHYTKLLFLQQKGLPLEESKALGAVAWRGKRVLDVGCGTGLLAYEIAKRGAAEVVGIDFSKTAITEAEILYRAANLSFLKQDVKDHRGTYDVIISLGTLEHMDDPLGALKLFKRHLRPGGNIVITSPNWSNPRGYMLQTLRFLFDAPITLADLHYLTPLDFERWSKKLGMKLEWETFDFSWAQGEVLLKDFTRRLPNVLRDAKLPNKQANIDRFIKWIKETILPLDHKTKFSGALGLYIFK